MTTPITSKQLAAHILKILEDVVADYPEDEQEPVAYMGSAGFGYDKNKYLSIPLYTAPPRKPWVGLTEDEVFEFLSDGVDGREDINNIEEALRSKNT